MVTWEIQRNGRAWGSETNEPLRECARELREPPDGAGRSVFPTLDPVDRCGGALVSMGEFELDVHYLRFRDIA